MKKNLILSACLVVVLITLIFVALREKEVTLTGLYDVPKEELQWIPTFKQLYDDLSPVKQVCIEEKFPNKVEEWRADEKKWYVKESELEVIHECLNKEV